MLTNPQTRRDFLQGAAAVAGGWLLSSRPAVARLPALRHRKEVRNLTAAEVDCLRTAYHKLQQKAGSGGYADLAGMHGVPKHYCPHGSPLFLPWHRAYILAFEDALRSFEPGVTLPYWDWTSQQSIQHGIPTAFAVPKYQSGGQMVANPLYSALIPATNKQTVRNPQPPSLLASLNTQVHNACANNVFVNFSSADEMPHNNLHGWVGGDMGFISWG